MRRRIAMFGLLLGVLASGSVSGQDGPNWHLLHNGFDGIYPALGIGGGLATNADGQGLWIAGEDLHGSTPRASDGLLAYKLIDVEFVTCHFTPSGSGPADWNPYWSWYEADGGNENAPWVFTPAVCSSPGLIGTSVIGPAAGSPPGTLVSFVIQPVPSAIGTGSIVLPNNGLLPTSNGGTLNHVASLFLGGAVGVPTGCIAWSLSGVTTVIAVTDNIDGLWHWSHNNPGGAATLGQTYHGFSFNEIETYRSKTVAGIGAGMGAFLFPATTTLAYKHSTLEAQTMAALAPQGSDPLGTGQPLGTYYTTTANTNSGIGGIPVLDPNGGFDSGSGASTLSLSGVTGVPDGNDVLAGGTILAAQDPAGGSGGGGGFVPTLAFQSLSSRDYSNLGGGPSGDERVTWIAFYWDAFSGVAPEGQTDVLAGVFGTRVPVVNNTSNPGSPGADFLQTLTSNLLVVYTHTTVPVGAVALGQSTHLPTTAAAGGACIGVPLALSFGTSTFDTTLGTFTWNPSTGSTSGRKVIHILD